MAAMKDAGWPELVKHPGECDHLVHVYRESEQVIDAAAEFIGTGIARGEAGVVIARPAHGVAIVAALHAKGLCPGGALQLIDAERTLVSVMSNGVPHWPAFVAACGRPIAELRLQYPGVRAYGEMVDLLWQQDRCSAALALEDYWNELARARPFALLCGYRIDPLQSASYGSGFERLCRAHSHLVPVRDYAGFNEAVDEAARRVLEPRLAHMLSSVAATHRPGTDMPAGQAVLFWLKHNMPRTAEKVLAQVREQLAA